MNIITVSRQSGSRGDEITDLLARTLELDLIDKESLESALVRHGIPEDRVEQYDEKKPGFWDLLSSDRDRYYHYLKAAILESAREGNRIIVGRGAQVILSGIPGVLHIRIMAPMEVRVRRIMDGHQCDEQHAKRLIRESDHNRSGFYHVFFNVDWESPDLYDVTFNTEALTPEHIVTMAKSLIESPAFQDTDATRRRLGEMSIAQNILTSILFEEQIPLRFPAVDVRDGVATISGAVNATEHIDRCLAVAARIEGVSRVEHRITNVPEIYEGPYM